MKTAVDHGRAAVFALIRKRVLAVWTKAGKPTRATMSKRTNIPQGWFPDLRTGSGLTWAGAEAVLLACRVEAAELHHWSRVVAAVQPVHADGFRGHDVRSGARRRGGRSPMSHSDESPLESAGQADDAAGFNQALNGLRRSNGLSYQALSDSVEAFAPGGLPRSTAHHMCNRPTLPARAEQVERFVLGCGRSAEEAAQWVAEWNRLLRREQQVKADWLRSEAPTAQFPRREFPVVEVPAPRAECETGPAVDEGAAPDRKPWWKRVIGGLRP